MARNPRTRGARRTLMWFAVLLLGLYALLAGVSTWGTAQWTPKLGLDLAGGTQVVLAPQVRGGQSLDQSRMDEAVNIMQKRVDASGVAEAEVTTQGGRNIVVNLPKGTPQDTVDSLKKSSMMRFRAVLVEGAATPQAGASATGTPAPGSGNTGTVTPGKTPTVKPTTGTPMKAPVATPSATASGARGLVPPAAVQAAPSATGTPTPSATPAATTPAAKATTPAASGATAPATLTPTPAATGAAAGAKPKNPSDPAWITPAVQAQYDKLVCTPGKQVEVQDDPAKPLVTCSTDGAAKYILGPAELEGSNIADATSGLQPSQAGGTGTEYGVNLTLDSSGSHKFTELTQRLLALPQPRNEFAAVLDGAVIVSPRSTVAIYDGKSSITGGFTEASAANLAQQLKFGALPVSFRVETQDTVSPTLGTDQLHKGLLAGLIGFLLVVIYALFQYRALGLVTVASLLMAGAITYVSVTLLGWSQNFRLSMAGVTGLILSIGTTADSFIVYFERVRDEIREGRSVPAAVEAGWGRAKGTILISDAVNLIAAVVLYLLASSNVRGFAYTLGLTTIIDVVLVFLFTHPVLSILSRTRFFGQGHTWSGFDREALGAKPARYVGRGRFRDPDAELDALEAERAANRRPGTNSKEGGAVL